MILGIGVNVNYPVDLMPEEIRQRATSVFRLCRKQSQPRRCSAEIDSRPRPVLWRTRGKWLCRRWRLVGRLTLACEGNGCALSYWIRLCSEQPKASIKTGALLLEDDHGELQRVIAGDVIPAGTIDEVHAARYRYRQHQHRSWTVPRKKTDYPLAIAHRSRAHRRRIRRDHSPT